MMLKKLGLLAILLSLLFSAAAPMTAFAQDDAAPVAEAAADDPEAVAQGGFFTVLTSGGLVGMLIWILLLLTSLAMMALIIDSFISVNEGKIIPVSLVSRVQEAMEQGDVIKALNVCNEEPGPMSNILSGAFENVEGGFEAIQDSVAIAADLESERLIQRVNYLNVVGNLAPMLGLLGTARSFSTWSRSLSSRSKCCATSKSLTKTSSLSRPDAPKPQPRNRMARKAEEPDPPNMTPMIDIVFQIIIFFVFTVDMDQAKFDKENPQLDPRTVHIDLNKQTETRNVVFVGSSPVSMQQLSGILNGAARRYGNDTPIVIRASEQLEHRYIKAVMDAASAVGLWKIEIAAIKEKI